jgi:hypothetical protein
MEPNTHRQRDVEDHAQWLQQLADKHAKHFPKGYAKLMKLKAQILADG